MTTTSILSINLKLVCKKLNEIEKKEYIFHFYGMKDYSSFQDSKRGKRTWEYDFQGIEYE